MMKLFLIAFVLFGAAQGTKYAGAYKTHNSYDRVSYGGSKEVNENSYDRVSYGGSKDTHGNYGDGYNKPPQLRTRTYKKLSNGVGDVIVVTGACVGRSHHYAPYSHDSPKPYRRHHKRSIVHPYPNPSRTTCPNTHVPDIPAVCGGEHEPKCEAEPYLFLHQSPYTPGTIKSVTACEATAEEADPYHRNTGATVFVGDLKHRGYSKYTNYAQTAYGSKSYGLVMSVTVAIRVCKPYKHSDGYGNRYKSYKRGIIRHSYPYRRRRRCHNDDIHFVHQMKTKLVNLKKIVLFVRVIHPKNIAVSAEKIVKKPSYGNHYGSQYRDGHQRGGYDTGYKLGGHDRDYKHGGYDKKYKQDGYDTSYKQDGYDTSYKQGGYDTAYKQDNYETAYKDIGNSYNGYPKSETNDAYNQKDSYVNKYPQGSYNNHQKGSYNNDYSNNDIYNQQDVGYDSGKQTSYSDGYSTDDVYGSGQTYYR